MMIKETNARKLKISLELDMGTGEISSLHNDMCWYKVFNEPPYQVRVTVNRLLTKKEEAEKKGR